MTLHLTADELISLVDLAGDSTTDVCTRHAAFAELVARFQDMAYGYAYAIVGDASLAQDAAQETFVTAFQNLGQLRDARAFPGWLRRIVLTQSHRLARAQIRAIECIEAMARLASYQPDPAAIVERRQLQERLEAAINALPEAQRVAFILHYINDYSQREIADFLETSVDAVKKQLQRARERLQEEMMDMAKEDLRRRRPSQNDKLVQAVRLFASLPAAAEQSELSMLELMVVDGVDVDARNEDGETLLHWAARQGNMDGAALLLKSGASVDAADKSGRTPLQIAIGNGHEDVADLLRYHTKT